MTSLRRSIALAALAILPTLPVMALETGQTFGDWTVACGADPDQADRNVCQLFQDIQAQREGVDDPQTLLRVRIGYDPDQQIAAVILQMPLGLLLREGVLMQVDDTDALRLGVQTCTPQGCRAVMPLDATKEAQFRAGNLLKVRVATINGQAITMGVSLVGFGSGMDALIGG